MIVPQFLRFYSGYTIDSTMNEYAVTFFSLVNAMYRIQASEMLDQVHVNAIPNMEKQPADNALAELRKGARGIHGILEEVRIIKGKQK
jgi:3-deoxy-D-arabino-heptulosonate 7-phosphate (DAHP) synthase